MEGNEIFRPAGPADAAAVLALYKQNIGTEYSTWNEYYPGTEEIEYDISHSCMYICECSGEIISALSVAYENELDDIDDWTIRDVPVREVYRVVVARSRQGKGLCQRMMLELEKRLAAAGVGVIRLLAAKKNIPAVTAYLKLGYTPVCDYENWGIEFLACEKRIGRGE